MEEIVKEIQKSFPNKRRLEVRGIYREIVEVIKDCLNREEGFSVAHFGTFSIKDKDSYASVGTGNLSIIARDRFVSFKPSHSFKVKLRRCINESNKSIQGEGS